MKKILFIIPPNVRYQEFINSSSNVRFVKKKDKYYRSLMTDMPLGIFSLSSYLKKNTDVETKLLNFNIVINKMEDFQYSSFKDVYRAVLTRKEFKEFSPDIIGLSVLFSPAYSGMLELAEVCKELFPDTLLLAGGGIPTNMYKTIYSERNALDALCFGEGEIPLLELVKSEDMRAHLKQDDSWITFDKVTADKKYRHKAIKNLDEVPFYDYDICEIEDYEINPAISIYTGVKSQKRNFHIMTSRGCPFKCIFCSSHTVHGREMRYLSLERIREDFKKLKENYNVGVIVFQDDHFLSDKKRALTIINMVKEFGFDCIFQNSLALYALDLEVLQTLKSAGIDYILLAVESGSQRVLKEVMHKPLQLDVVRKVVENCRAIGIKTGVNILIGLPGETKADIEEGTIFLKELKSGWYYILCANPLVGSEMYDICVEKDYLKEDFLGGDYQKAVVETEDFSAEYIQEKAYEINLELNYVCNSDMRLGDYPAAIIGFEKAIVAKNDHAFAYYYASICYEKIGEKEKSAVYMQKAKEFSKNQFWKKYTKHFNIEI